MTHKFHIVLQNILKIKSWTFEKLMHFKDKKGSHRNPYGKLKLLKTTLKLHCFYTSLLYLIPKYEYKILLQIFEIRPKNILPSQVVFESMYRHFQTWEKTYIKSLTWNKCLTFINSTKNKSILKIKKSDMKTYNKSPGS